jgi:hypothetical protein
VGRTPDISARRLHRASLKFRDRIVMAGSVFPLFDRDGTVWKFMLVWRGSDRILLLDHAPGRIRQNWWGYSVDASLAEERPLTRVRVAGIGRLWHYDPWWVLRSSRYAGHPAAAKLKETNLLGPSAVTIHRLHFESDLSRVASCSTDRIGPMSPFDPGVLPGKCHLEKVDSRRTRSNWKLRPLWLPR